jgi:MFS family permease
MNISVAQRLRFARALRSQPFALLWSGQTISALGDGTFFTTQVWQVLLFTHSAVAVGIVAAAGLIPQLLFLVLGGVAADRLSRRSIMIISDVGRAAIVLVIAGLGWLHLLQLWHLVVLAILFGFVKGFFAPAYQAFLPQLATREDLSSVNALTSLSRQATLILGPPLAVTLIGVGGPAFSFGFDGLTFVISVFCLLLLRLPESTGNAAEQEKPAELASRITASRALRQIVLDVREGVVYVIGTPWLWISIVVGTLTNIGIAGSLDVAIPRLAQTITVGGIWLLGAMEAAMPAGQIVGTLLAGQLQEQMRRGWILYLSLAFASLALLVLGLPIPHEILLFVAPLASAGFGLGLGAFSVLWVTLLQELVPQDKLGRVSSLDLLGSFSLIPLGFVLAGVLADQLGPASVFLVTGVVNVTLVALALTARSIRQLR